MARATTRAGGLDPAVRRGYGVGSVATGAFGTVPGLLLLPYLTDHIGIAAGVAVVQAVRAGAIGIPDTAGAGDAVQQVGRADIRGEGEFVAAGGRGVRAASFRRDDRRGQQTGAAAQPCGEGGLQDKSVHGSGF